MTDLSDDELEVEDKITGLRYVLSGKRVGIFFAARMPGRFNRIGPTGEKVSTLGSGAVFHESGVGMATFLAFADAVTAADELSRFMPADFHPETMPREVLREKHPIIAQWLREIDAAGKAIGLRQWCNRNGKKTPPMQGPMDVDAELEAARRNLR